MRNIFDHIRYGSSLKYYIYPSFSLPDVVGFEDGLRDVIPQKLGGLLDCCQELKTQKDNKLRAVLENTKEGSIEEYLWASLALHEFSEYFVIQKWINYWLSLWYRVSPDKALLKTNENKLNWVNEADIDRASQNPIQNFYEGRLRKSGPRYVGLCPFHQEKTPSFTIYPNNTYHCCGCQAHGNVISFIKNTKGFSFLEAVRHLL